MSFKPHQSFIPDRVSRANQPGLGPYNNVHAYISHSRQPLHVGSSDHATSTGFWNQEPRTPDLDAVHGSPSPFDPSANASRLLSASSRTQFSTQPTNSANDCMRSSVQVRRSGATAMDLGPHTHSNDGPCSTSLMSLNRVTAPKHFNSERALGDPSPSSLPRLIDTEYVILQKGPTGNWFFIPDNLQQIRVKLPHL